MGRDYKEHRMFSILNTIRIPSPTSMSGRRFFAIPLIEGKISLFLINNFDQVYPHRNRKDYFQEVLVNNNMETIDFSWKKLRKNKLEVFSECPELLKLLKAKDSKITSLSEVVNS